METDRTDLDAQALRLAIERERAELDRLRDASSESRAVVTLDQQTQGRLSRMDAMQTQAMAQAAEQRRIRRRHALDAALRRMAEGEYGYCVGCGEPIAVKRLKVDPVTASCIACAK